MRSKRTSRLLCALLALVMVLAMLPGVAFAEEEQTVDLQYSWKPISTVYINNVVEPVVGEGAAHTYTYAEPDKYMTASNSYWLKFDHVPTETEITLGNGYHYGNTSALLYEEGYYYVFCVRVRAKDASAWELTEDTSVYINGTPADYVTYGNIDYISLFAFKVFKPIQKPVITRNPYDRSAEVGDTIAFSVGAKHATSYEWFVTSEEGYGSWYYPLDEHTSDFSYSGENTDTLKLTLKNDYLNGKVVYCKVMNEDGTVTSSYASITLKHRPTITKQPQDATGRIGEPITFTIEAEGATSYEWHVADKENVSVSYYNLEDYASDFSYSGENTSTFTITPKTDFLNGKVVWCRVTSDYSADSKPATVRLRSADGREPLEYISITGVQNPAVGYVLEHTYDVTNSAGLEMSLAFACWLEYYDGVHVVTSWNDLYTDDHGTTYGVITPGKTHKAGSETYAFQIYLDLPDGYTVDEYTTITVNGMPATLASKQSVYYNANHPNVVRVVMYFGHALSQFGVDDVSIYDVTTPVAGEAASHYFTIGGLNTSAYIAPGAKDGSYLAWIESDTPWDGVSEPDKGTRYYEDDGLVFKPDKYYTAWFCINPVQNDEEFYFIDGSVDGTVNGEIADYTYDDFTYAFVYKYYGLPEGGSAPNPNPGVSFTDVKNGDWFYNAVNWAVSTGVTAGMGDGTFGVGRPCTRAQAVTFIWNNAGKPQPKSTNSPFSDVKSGDWYYSAVLWAYENNITAGMGDGTFGVNRPCTRAQIVQFLYNAAGKPSYSTKTSPFTDVKSGDWYYDAVLWAVENGVTSGMGDGTFGASGTCTREQIVQFLYNAAGKPSV